MKKRIELAPMEGIITASFRKCYKKYFKGIDRYYTPFIAANQTHTFKAREKREFIPYEEDLVPQILTNDPDDLIWAMRELSDLGYKEVNLNIGCPSGTVVAKGKGAGMLKDISALDGFFDVIFEAIEKENLPGLSVKTRVGMTSHKEAYDIAETISGYPFSAIIVHPRIREEYYNENATPDSFEVFYDKCQKSALIYNGDLNSPPDVDLILKRFPYIKGVMLGRGALVDPFLPSKVSGEKDNYDPNVIYLFLQDLWDEYASYLSGDRDILFKMKDLWNFLGKAYPHNARELKQIKKAKNRNEYDIAVKELLLL